MSGNSRGPCLLLLVTAISVLTVSCSSPGVMPFTGRSITRHTSANEVGPAPDTILQQSLLATGQGPPTPGPWSTAASFRAGITVNDIDCPAVSTCYAVGSIGKIGGVAKSSDTGRSWTLEALP